MTQLARVQQGRETQITFTFTKAGVAVDPTGQTATVQILRGDGTELVAAATNAPRLGVGVYSITLTPAQTALLDRLRVLWTGTLDAAVQTFPSVVEVAGGFLFDLTTARGKLNANSAITDVAIQETRVAVEQSLEEAIACALTPRWERQKLDGQGDDILVADWPRITAIRGVTIAGVALTADEIDAQIAFNGRILQRTTGTWPDGYGNVVVDYEHGYDLPPVRMTRAGLIIAQDWLQQGPLTERATTFSSVDGGTFALMTAGMRGAMFGFPDVEAAVQMYDHHSRV